MAKQSKKPTPTLSTKQIRETHDEEAMTVITAKLGRQSVGTVNLIINNDRAWLDDFKVTEPRQGIGTALLDKAKELAHAAGCTELAAVAWRSGAKAFYVARGAEAKKPASPGMVTFRWKL